MFGLVAAVIVWFILKRTRWGFEIRLIGDNPRAARYAGVNIARNIIVVFMVSGGLAGLAGMSEVAGSAHVLQTAISPGYGFTAIIVAYLAKFNPFGVVVSAILFGGLILAGREIQPSGIPQMIQGVILFTLIASDVLLRYRVRLRRPAPAAAPASPVGLARDGLCRHRRRRRWRRHHPAVRVCRRDLCRACRRHQPRRRGNDVHGRGVRLCDRRCYR